MPHFSFSLPRSSLAPNLSGFAMALIPFSSRLLADVGSSMGDEGKGRVIPELIQELHTQTGRTDPVGMVLKVNGGANAGHTCGGLKLNLVPAAVIEDSVRWLGIGAGVVADPLKFNWELAYLLANGYNVRPRLLIDEACMVSDVSHRLLDLAWEHYRAEVLGHPRRGSTGRGISPAYIDETAHFQLKYYCFRGNKDRFADSLRARLQRAVHTILHVCQVDEASWQSFFEILTAAELRAHASLIDEGKIKAEEFHFNRFKGEDTFTLNEDAVIDAYWEAGQRLLECIGEVRQVALEALKKDQYVIGEFGQSYWLDKRFGFQRSLTASHTFTPELFQSANIPLQTVHTVGVCKAYDTKVGNHYFITQIPEANPLSSKLKKLEFGATTGRQRMVGWFDAVEKGDALRYGGYQDLVINKLDALSYSGDWQGGELLVCVGYRKPDGTILKHVPRDDQLHETLKAVYIQCPGWDEDISQIRSFNHLPGNCQRYVRSMLTEVIKVAYGEDQSAWPDNLPNLRYIGVGPEPTQIIKDIPESRELIIL